MMHAIRPLATVATVVIQEDGDAELLSVQTVCDKLVREYRVKRVCFLSMSRAHAHDATQVVPLLDAQCVIHTI